MEKIFVNTPAAKSEIIVGQTWESVKELLPESGVVIITDDNILRLYGDKFPDLPVFSVTAGEESKKLSVIEYLAGRLLDSGIDRSGFILAVGGGVVCDLAGFLASVYMRGIKCGFVSTSLLSQVDASTGGKNGVNLGTTKNMIGTIRQPEFVICDPAMLLTLPEDEYLSGLSELIKTAVIGDKGLFEIIENSIKQILDRDCDLLTMLVTKAVSFKSMVVSEDEKENGLRRILNFGHTYGHAIELQRAVKHGFAVASGMELATEFSCEKGFVSAAEKERIIKLLNRFQLLDRHYISDNEMEEIITHDKKKAGSFIHFVFTEGIGQSSVKKISVSEILSFYKKFRDKS
ncbi:MAG: 3-dehydroquinate synthase [Bacteroidetes bacterium GWE2_41_25]|nr:MAG: 3-dehydroquinate synthase [Bacteroidetes bacterium GWA2_40_15]OFX94807.1 MAG: 3-dehydroquinate synthase [Bacteroidetes bacterium GWC2_40_22]OFY00460.1 MAG: 3-dehydroquinate synthase [Bacteroidetes bacterium GWE2_41_25]OFY60912.1 MAG: 3-dehydroquinate synthase [Bacteroidetes bacterium GWF2_41_9]HBH84275.1 3-dehydroquinate synthase [Bacteroidales bacterium]